MTSQEKYDQKYAEFLKRCDGCAAKLREAYAMTDPAKRAEAIQKYNQIDRDLRKQGMLLRFERALEEKQEKLAADPGNKKVKRKVAELKTAVANIKAHGQPGEPLKPATPMDANVGIPR